MSGKRALQVCWMRAMAVWFLRLLSLPGFKLWYTVKTFDGGSLPGMEREEDVNETQRVRERQRARETERERVEKREREKALNGVWLWMLMTCGFPPSPLYSNCMPPSLPACRSLLEPRCRHSPSLPTTAGPSLHPAWRTTRDPPALSLKSR